MALTKARAIEVLRAKGQEGGLLMPFLLKKTGDLGEHWK
jgi:hypothetical protein